MAGLFIGFLVEKCAACQSHWKSDFGLHLVHLAWCVRPSKKKVFLVPARFIFWSRLCFFLFVSSNVCSNKNQKALLLLCSQFSSIDYKENSKCIKKEMTFVCVSIRTQAKILMPCNWYARSVVDRSITLQDLFCKFASGEFYDGGKNIDIRTTQAKECKQLFIPVNRL